MHKKSSSKDVAWPPTGVQDLKPDIRVETKTAHGRFPTLRAALEPAPGVTPNTLTSKIVRDVLQRNRRQRNYCDVEYLCLAYLQPGGAAMTSKNLELLCATINKFNK